MRRLIDANALIATLEKIADADETPFFHLDEIVDEIMDAPTVDAVEVVRCKNCKNWDQKQCADGYGWCDKVSAFKLGKWYCADGVNKSV